MAKLDRLGWAAGISFESHGASIGIRVNDPAVLDRISAHLPPGWSPSASPVVNDLYSVVVGRNAQKSNVRCYNLLYWGAGRMARTMDLDELFETLEASLHFSVAVGAQSRLFVHAGVVGWRGKAIVIPGRSMSGKTSLVKALVQAGASYLSDEFAVFDEQGYVHPYPRPLSVRQEGTERPQKFRVEALGGCSGTDPLPVGMIAVTEYQPEVRWRPRVLSPSHALLALLDNTVLARVRPKFALDMLRPVVPGVVALKGRRGEAEDVVPRMLRRLEESVS